MHVCTVHLEVWIEENWYTNLHLFLNWQEYGNMEICGPLTLDLQYSIKKKCVHAVQDFIYLKNHLNKFNSCNFQKSEYLSEKSN